MIFRNNSLERIIQGFEAKLFFFSFELHCLGHNRMFSFKITSIGVSKV